MYPSLPLFCFGTLMDPEVLTEVSACAIHELTIADAIVDDYAQREVVEESYPILVPVPGASAKGRLVYGLTATAMDRIRFFEGEEYELDTLEVIAGDKRVEACWFRDTGAYQDTGREWSYARWQSTGHEEFMHMTRQYMALHSTMTLAEADAHWRMMSSAP